MNNLTWILEPNFRISWNKARAACAERGGRLPTKNELLALKSVMFTSGDFGNAINLSILSRYEFWSSDLLVLGDELYDDDLTEAWMAKFNDDGKLIIFEEDYAEYGHMMCVF